MAAQKKVINPTAKQTTVRPPVAKAAKKPAKKSARSANSKPKYKWDVIAAEKDYLSDVKLSYQDIATKYKIGIKAVERYAKKHKWADRRQEVGKKGMESFEQKHAALISETNEEHLRIYKNTRNIIYNEILKNAKGETTKADIKLLGSAVYAMGKAIEGERTVLGLPTVIQEHGDGKKPADNQATWADIMDSLDEAEKQGLIPKISTLPNSGELPKGVLPDDRASSK